MTADSDQNAGADGDATGRTRRRLTSAAAGLARRVGAIGPLRRAGAVLAIVAVSLAGVVLGVLLGAHTRSDVGPFTAQLSLTPSANGGTEVDLPPLGALLLDTHDGPAHLSVRLNALDQSRTEALINTPDGITTASRTAVQDVADGVIRLGTQTLGVAVLGALALAAVIFRDVRRVAWSGGLALAVTAGSLGIAAATFRVNAIEEPSYRGLLVNAPAVVGDARRIANRYDQYAAQLQRLVGNVSKLYSTVSTLPVFQAEPGTTRVLHISDMHLNPAAWSVINTVTKQFDIDMVIDTGDLTDWGSEPEASYVSAIGRLGVPYVYIRGNHDSAATAAAVARQPNAIVLDNQVRTVDGLTIAGIGDPRFTPDKKTSPAGSGDSKQTIERVTGAGERLAATIERFPKPVDIALVHDPASAGALAGVCPLVLAGHIHHREVRELAAPPGGTPTRLMVEGSTGGAGLRGLEGSTPLPLELSVLYFDQNRKLQAYDDIKVGGTGLAQVSLNRHVIDETHVGALPGASASPGPGGGSAPPPSAGTSPAVGSGSATPVPSRR